MYEGDETVEERLRGAIRRSGRSLHSIALGARVDYANLYQFFHGRFKSMKLATAQRVWRELGLRLVEGVGGDS
jgi:hypothetical protein